VIIRFSAETYAPRNARLMLRVQLDGVGNGELGPVVWTHDHDENNNGRGYRVHTFDFVYVEVAPGLRRVWVLWRSPDGVEVNIRRRTTTVHHN
jgi:hypothetical protein